MTKLLVTLALVSLICGAWGQDNAQDQLVSVLQRIDYLQGRFSQRQYAEDGSLLAESAGHFRLLRPGYFGWQIETPDSQLIIADPHYLWHHDQDLETVTRRPVTASGELSPLQILGGDENLLRNRFEIEQLAGNRFSLVPDTGNPGFSRLVLILDGDTVVGMEIIDSLDQRIDITFENLDRTTALTPADFAFTVPDGVDLFYYDE
ncbi:MAG: outer membrane lipoprotein chaperone LolA [Halieaceae bacterium]|jgi:outer membrane lipoprotein carrier protein|nr:outer membrane lipoprotein chaperone LolA [Halieaceae bacterium]